MSIAKSTTTRVCDYMRRIRNKAKKHYAFEYWHYVLGNKRYPFTPSELSMMAAQAVRMNIDKIMAD